MEKYDERLNQYYQQGHDDFTAGRQYSPPFGDINHRHRGLTEEEDAIVQAYQSGWEDAKRLSRRS